MILNYCKKKENKSFLSYCPKLYGTGLEPGTFEFVTYLTTEPTTLLNTYGFSRFYFGCTQLFCRTIKIINKKLKTKKISRQKLRKILNIGN